jgi:micrococcal nuclease
VLTETVGCVPADARRDEAQVARVIDGDTIEVSLEGQAYRVRYIGVDSPEPGDSFGEQARTKNLELLEGQRVLLVKDVSETDRYGRLLRYVFVDDLFVNLALVQSGFASAATFPPDVACAGTFLKAERLAREQAAGIWAQAANSAIPTTQAPGESGGSAAGAAGGGACDPSYPGVCIPPPPPDLDCGDIGERRFQVVPPDAHNFDRDHDGLGCES